MKIELYEFFQACENSDIDGLRRMKNTLKPEDFTDEECEQMDAALFKSKLSNQFYKDFVSWLSSGDSVSDYWTGLEDVEEF